MARFLSWLVIKPKALWLGLVVPLGLAAITWSFPLDPGLCIRIAGFLSTSGGVLLVVASISNRLELFGKHGFLGAIGEWLRGFPQLFRGPQVVNMTGSATVGALTSAGDLEVGLSLRENPTIERRVEVLEREVKNLANRIQQFRDRLAAEIKRIEGRLNEEISTTARKFQELQSKVEDLSLGGIAWEITGVFWLILGSFMTTFSTGTGHVVNAILKAFP